jgi:hypothetical protein
VLATFAWYWYRNTTTFLAGAQQAPGTVIEIVERHTTDDEGRTRMSRHPVVRFEVEDRAVEFESTVGGGRSAYDVGESVAVAYEPADPRHARIVSFRELYLYPLLSGVAGGALFVGGAIARTVAWRRELRSY